MSLTKTLFISEYANVIIIHVSCLRCLHPACYTIFSIRLGSQKCKSLLPVYTADSLVHSGDLCNSQVYGLGLCVCIDQGEF